MLHWTKEDTPRWDAAKQRLFGPEELAATGMAAPGPGSPIADEWRHVTGDDGEVAGYGWLDSEWGDAEVTFLVGRDRRGTGIGGFIVDRLEEEAAGRGCQLLPLEYAVECMSELERVGAAAGSPSCHRVPLVPGREAADPRAPRWAADPG